MTVGTTRADRGPGPTRLGLAALALSAFALLATSPALPSLQGRAIGEVALGGGESVERELRIHVDPRAPGATSGSILTSVQAASGLEAGETGDVTIALAAASDAAGSFDPGPTFPVDRCRSGCDLTYRIRISAAPGVLPGSIVRYVVDVRVEFGNQSGPSPDPGLMRLDLDGPASGPVVALWSLVAGLLALALGIALGPRADRALTPRRREWPTRGLIAVAIGLAVWVVLSGVFNLLRPNPYSVLHWSPELILAVADPWSLALVGTLVWGVWRGVRRWPTDGGWLLGLAAVALTGLGGLWLASWTTLAAVVQPIVLAIPFVLLGSLGGLVIGQGWRTDPAARHDRSWATFAVLGHGVVIAGFGFLAEQSLYDPFSASPTSLLALGPAILVALAFQRWLGGRQRWLILFDLIIAAVGLLGLRLWSSLNLLGSPQTGSIEIGYVAVLLAVVAAVVAFVTALHRMPRSAQVDGPGPAPTSGPIEGSTVTPLDPSDDVRSTT